MHYTADFCMCHYAGFLQIGSHMAIHTTVSKIEHCSVIVFINSITGWNGGNRG